ncbi:MAG: hypothetical protein GY719_22440 [bacterium]|nr:hypothetical protein [bacterium]
MHEIALGLLILLAGIWLVAVTLRPLRVPTVMGELIVGVLVGPAVFGWIEPGELLTLISRRSPRSTSAMPPRAADQSTRLPPSV